MTKIIKVVSLAALCAVLVVPLARAERNHLPTAGKPFTTGSGSFDWGFWTYVDNQLTNTAGFARAWIVPLMSGPGRFARIRAEIANSASGTTTAQALANYPDGTRAATGNIFYGSGTTLSDFYLGELSGVSGGTYYVKFVVARSGGKVGRVQIFP